jgi:hypothetical protein
MKLKSIEPTPNPNSMKLNLDESLPSGTKYSYTLENIAHAPLYLQGILQITGIKSVYQVQDFIAIERNPKTDWKLILGNVQEILEGNSTNTGKLTSARVDTQSSDPIQEVSVFVQMYRGIPLQVKLLSGLTDQRFGLPEAYKKAATQAAGKSADFLQERSWQDYGVRYGVPEEIGPEVVELLLAAYDPKRLEVLIEQVTHQGSAEQTSSMPSPEELGTWLRDPDWKKRYAALDQLNPNEETLPLIKLVIGDENSSIRRLATVYLGAVGTTDVFPLLFSALKDGSVSVRRAAGDCLSDLGNPIAIQPMSMSLQDASKIVRWRAARFLYEVGDETAIPALRLAAEDPEFEVQLQVKMALERIEGGETAKGPIWQQLTKSIGSES